MVSAVAPAQVPDAPSTRPGGGRAPIEARLLEEVNALGEAQFWVMLRDQADLGPGRNIRDWRAKGQFVHSALMTAANHSQPRIRSLVQSRGGRQRSFWILNTIQVTGNRQLIEELAAQPEVEEIRANRTYSIPPLITAIPRTNANGVEWNVDRINAPVVWNSYGVRGENVVVCNIDTGVQFDHPALVDAYRGNLGEGAFSHDYNWFDASTTDLSPVPYDNNGHGTHTMGTIVGDGGPGNRIGVAPGAKWMAVKGCASNLCDPDALLAAAEWILAPTRVDGSDPDPSKRPNIVNNSWGGDMWMDPWFQAVLQRWLAAGIFPVFAVGNAGSECWTAFSPADYPEAYSVGAFDISDNLGTFSSGGPTFFGGIKPDISAPGVEVRSSVPNSGYATVSGTSMAAPHVAGVVALLWSAAPALKGDIAATRALLDSTAINMPDLRCGGSPTNNNTWGHGRVDASIAVNMAPRGELGALVGGVTNALTGEALVGAQVTVSGPLSRTTSTDTNGQYSFSGLPVGNYDVLAAAYGFASQITNGFFVDASLVSTQDFALQPTTTAFGVSGVVASGGGAPIAGVVVTILGATNPPATTAADGSYSFTNIAEGTYQVRAEPNCCFTGVTQELVLTTDVAGFDFSLAQRVDAFGYRCEVVTPAYVEATTPIPFSGTNLYGNDFYAPVSLPFPFPFYGITYTNAFVSCNGFISFAENTVQAYWNARIPANLPPNAGIYCFWDDLIVNVLNPVRTRLSGAAPNRQFVIEWRDVTIQGSWGTMDVEAVLKENGQIVMQYRDVPSGADFRGASATIGIENESGTVALQYSQHQAVLTTNLAIAFTLPPAAFVQGHVTDLNDGQPIRSATVRITQEGLSRDVATDDSGFYRTQILLGTPTIEARANNYQSVAATPSLLNAGATYVQDFALPTGQAQVNPGGLQFSVAAGQTRTLTLTITNTGTRDLNWSLNPFNSYEVSSEGILTRNPQADPDARTTRNVFAGGMIMDWPALSGEVLKVWQPAGIALPWGVLFGTNVWLTDATPSTTNRPDIFEFTTEGVGTGESRDTATNGAWVADMAYDSAHGLVCQVNVGGSGAQRNCISCWDPLTGLVVTNISGTWTNKSQRGIAYRPDTDTFYIGSWETGVIYHIKGLSWDLPGEVIGQFFPSDGSIAGLAWNERQGVLWEASNGFNDLIYALDPTNGTVLLSLKHPDPGYNGGGLECDLLGNLWMVSQTGQKAYLVNSGITTFTNIPWVSFSVTNGVIAPGEVGSFEVTVHGTNFAPGQYAANLFLQTDGGRETLQSVDLLVAAVEGSAVITNFTGGSPQNNSNSWLGMQFTVGTNPVSVTALGRLASAANSQSHTLKLVRASDGQDVLGSELSVDMAGGTLGQFKYETLPSAIVLEPDTTYYLVSSELEAGDLWQSAATEVSASPVIADIVPVCQAFGEAEWQTNDLPGHSFGPVDFKYLTPRVLSVTVSNEWADAQALAWPTDLLGRTVGEGSFTRVYDDGTQAALTAARISGPLIFREWQKDGSTFSTNNSVTLMMSEDFDLRSSYSLPVVTGRISSGSGIALSNVVVQVSGATNTSWMTDSSGDFSGTLFAAGDFSIVPELAADTPIAHEVTVADLVIILRHLLGYEILDSPFELLAADVDGSGSVTVADLVLVNRLILGLDTSFPLGLWRFVPGTAVFPDPSAPWSAPTNSILSDLSSAFVDSDFVALKLGDVDISWRPPIPPLILKHSARSSPVRVQAQDAATGPGTIVAVPVTASGLQDVNGLQFTLNWDPNRLRLIRLRPTGLMPLSADNFGLALAVNGVLTFAWATAHGGANLPDESCIWIMDFEVLPLKGPSQVSFSNTPTFGLVETTSGRKQLLGLTGTVLVERDPANLSIELLAGEARLKVSTEVGFRYYVEFSDSLRNGAWYTLGAISGDGSMHTVIDSGATNRQRFYRWRAE